MSIAIMIKGLVNAGILFPYRPSNTRQNEQRRLFLTERAEKERIDPESAANMLSGKGPIHAALDRWVLGGHIYLSEKSRYLADLSPPPPEVWEIRVTEPVVQSRLFGRFVEQDTLILTSFHTRSYLGVKGSQAWADAMNDCVNQWGSLMPTLPVLSSGDIHDYIGGSCDDFKIKNHAARRTKSRKTRSGKLRNS